MISFSSGSTLLQIEDAYSKLENSDANSVRFPTNLSHGGTFGTIAALIQFIATWSRTVPSGAVIPYAAKTGIEAFSELLRQPHGLVAAYMSPRLADPKHQDLKKSEVLAQARSAIDAMQHMDRLRDTMSGRGVFLACFAGAQNEYLLPLYELADASHGLRGTKDFLELTKRIVGACAPELLRNASQESFQALSLILRELFENTNDHARTDELGREYGWGRPSVRGILAKYISFSSYEGAGDTLDGDIAHSLFFNRALLDKPKAKNSPLLKKGSQTRNFLELTVFDTGPGIAGRWNAHKYPEQDLDHVSIDKEEQLIREAFELGKTSKPGNGTGVGLDSVCKSMLELRALLRLRTGRLCLYQDFSRKVNPEFRPSHWLSDRKELARVSGTVFSVLIPLSSLAKA